MSDDENKSDQCGWIDVIEMTDDDGNTVKFELLDTLTFKGEKYMMITPFTEDEEDKEENDEDPYVVTIVLVTKTEDGKDVLEFLEDKIAKRIYKEFQKQNKENNYL